MTGKLNANIDSDDINRLTGYRFDATGVFGYSFYNDVNKFCSVSSSVGLSAPVRILGNRVKWKSDFDNCTVFPGLARSIIDESKGTQLFSIVYINSGEYKINESVSVYCDIDNYTFYASDKVIAKIYRFSGETDHRQKISETDSYDYKPYFEVVTINEIAPELRMVILAFPMFRFGL